MADVRTFGIDVVVAATRKAVAEALAKLNEDVEDTEAPGPADGAKSNGTTRSADGTRSTKRRRTSGEGVVQDDEDSWPPFEAVWGGYAGCGRESDRALLRPHIAALFPGASLRLTSDGDLLSAPISGVGAALVCGTGSVAQLWSVPTPTSEPERLLRSGGWGPLLDDRGSGFSLGKAAACSVLFYAANEIPLREWQGELLAQLGTDAEGLIRTVSGLDIGLSHADADSKRKATLAGLSRIVVKAAEEGDIEAGEVLGRIAKEVCEVLEPVRERLMGLGDDGRKQGNGEEERGEEEKESATLVVAGGLGLSPTFWCFVEDEFARRGWAWRKVAVEDPAKAGLDYLLRSAGAA